MTYTPPPSTPPHGWQPPTPPPDQGKRFLNMSGGILALVIAGVVALCCVLPLVLCLVSAISGAFDETSTDF
jgi:hypothetical protein